MLRTTLCLLALLPTTVAVEGPKGHPNWSAGSKDPIVYCLFTPSAKTGRLPLIVFLHGAGERGTGNHMWNDGGADIAMWSSRDFQAKTPCFIFAPQCPKEPAQWVDTPWGDGSYRLDAVPISKPMAAVIAVVEELRKRPDIDPDRVYLVGGSMGGFGAWDAAMRRPELWAAVVPIAGCGDPGKGAALAKAGTPVWAIHGADDSAIPASGSRDMVAAIHKAGGTAKLSDLAGVGHIWENAEKHAPGVTAWMFAQRRGAASAKPKR